MSKLIVVSGRVHRDLNICFGSSESVSNYCPRFCSISLHLSRLVGKQTFWFPTRSDINRTAVTVTDDKLKHEISNFGSRGIVLPV